MRKNTKVVMLDTNDKENSAIMLGVTPGVMRCTKDADVINDKSDWMKFGTAKHLYLISEDKIEKGGYAMYLENSTKMDPFRDAEPYLVNDIDEVHWNDKKIVGSSDPELKLYEGETVAKASGFNFKTNDILFPQIPQPFIQEFAKQGGIEEVELEYEWIRNDKVEAFTGYSCGVNVLKITPNNEVIIHLIK